MMSSSQQQPQLQYSNWMEPSEITVMLDNKEGSKTTTMTPPNDASKGQDDDVVVVVDVGTNHEEQDNSSVSSDTRTTSSSLSIRSSYSNNTISRRSKKPVGMDDRIKQRSFQRGQSDRSLRSVQQHSNDNRVEAMTSSRGTNAINSVSEEEEVDQPPNDLHNVSSPSDGNSDDDDDRTESTTITLMKELKGVLSANSSKQQQLHHPDFVVGASTQLPTSGGVSKLEQLRSSQRSRETQLKELVMEQQLLQQQQSQQQQHLQLESEGGATDGDTSDATNVMTVIVNLKDELMAAHDVIRLQRVQLENLLSMEKKTVDVVAPTTTTTTTTTTRNGENEIGQVTDDMQRPNMVPLVEYQRLQAKYSQLENDRAWGEFRLRDRITSDGLKFHRRLRHWKEESTTAQSTLVDIKKVHADHVLNLLAQVEEYKQRAMLLEQDLVVYKAGTDLTRKELCGAQDRIGDVEKHLEPKEDCRAHNTVHSSILGGFKPEEKRQKRSSTLKAKRTTMTFITTALTLLGCGVFQSTFLLLVSARVSAMS